MRRAFCRKLSTKSVGASLDVSFRCDTRIPQTTGLFLGCDKPRCDFSWVNTVSYSALHRHDIAIFTLNFARCKEPTLAFRFACTRIHRALHPGKSTNSASRLETALIDRKAGTRTAFWGFQPDESFFYFARRSWTWRR